MRWAWVSIAGLALAAAPALAEVEPVSGPGDPHIQTVAYDPQQVVALHVATGYALTVQLSPDERVETVTLGDSTNWQVSVNHRADQLVVKPLGYSGQTNLTVITDVRAYNFTLYGAGGGGPLPYTVGFTYPAAVPESVVPAAQPTGRYRLHGDRALRPAAISDDGQSTAIIWPALAAMPAVYSTDAGGALALVNGLMHDGAYVIQGVHRRLVFKLGKAEASASREAPKAAK